MKCMACNECSDKMYCAILNGLDKVPYPLVEYRIKGCHDSHIKELEKLRMLQKEIEVQSKEYFNNECFHTYADDREELEEDVTEAFQAGAKWGMKHATQWHDLRENPNDLPKVKGEYRAYIYDSGLKKNRTVNLQYWGHSWNGLIEVIAWCELPTYKE